MSTAEQATVGALDIGGSHVSAARVSLPAAAIEPGSRRRWPLRPDGERGELLAGITRAATAVRRQGMRGWGVAVPGPFDYQGGVCLIRGVGKLEALYGVDLGRELAGALELEGRTGVRFLNDADAFLLGEWWVGAAKGHRRCVGVTIGTGLGSAFLEDGRIVDADPRVPPDGRLDLVPFRGRPVEETVSRRGLLARYGAGEDGVDVEQIADRARAGDPEAAATFRDAFGALGELLVPWLDRFGASCLVLGGAIAQSFDLIAPPLMDALDNLPSLKVVTSAALGEDAPLLGAALHLGAWHAGTRRADRYLTGGQTGGLQPGQEGEAPPDVVSGDGGPKLRPHCDQARVRDGDGCPTQTSEVAVDKDQRGREGALLHWAGLGVLKPDHSPGVRSP